MTDDLPPLPKGTPVLLASRNIPNSRSMYTGDQMRDYARAAVAVEREKLAALREAAQAVVDRWDTPVWKDVPATAVYINALRAALGAK